MIKIGIEGAELALQDVRRMLKPGKPYLFIEAHSPELVSELETVLELDGKSESEVYQLVAS